jgi:hypothetical protein
VGSVARKPRPTGVQVANNDAMMSDVRGDASSQAIELAQIIEPEPPPPPPEPPEAPRQVESPPATATGSLLEVIAPRGELPGTAENLGNPRAMEASDDPASEAQKYIDRITTGRTYARQKSRLDALGGRVIKLSDGTYITYRPPGVSSSDTLRTTASVDLNSTEIKAMNGGQSLKLKFSKK